MARIILLFISFAISCVQAQKEESIQSNPVQADQIVKIPEVAPSEKKQKQIDEKNYFHICHSFLIKQRYSSRPQKQWSHGYRPLAKNNDTLVSAPPSHFDKGMKNNKIIDQKLMIQDAKIAVYKGKKADFKFILFRYPDSLILETDKEKFRQYSRYIIHAHSRIKHPNYYFSHQKYIFYFQTRASMFSGEVLHIMQKLEQELYAIEAE